MRPKLLDYHSHFFTSVSTAVDASEERAVVFGLEKDRARLEAMVDILRRHHIVVHSLGQDVGTGERTFKKEVGFFIPLDQPQYRLILSLFDRRTNFVDNSFYDVSRLESRRFLRNPVSQDRLRSRGWEPQR